jgi:hypothetical protein
MASQSKKETRIPTFQADDITFASEFAAGYIFSIRDENFFDTARRMR